MAKSDDERLAVLIDADNVPYSGIKLMLEELARYGTLTIKRIYADWTKPTVSGWKPLLLVNAITPIQQYSYTTGKNATDSAMIIDAMDILYSGDVDGFCIISSDSDFTRLATRLRESGMKVIGMGQQKTPEPFIAACEKFVFIEILERDAIRDGKKAPEAQGPMGVDKKLVSLISAAVNDISDDSGWAFLGELGNYILRRRPEFDPRNYGFPKLVNLIKSIGTFEIDVRPNERGTGKLVYVREKM